MSSDVKCSECGGLSEVITSRPVIDLEGGRVRRRLCRRCNRRWYSLQSPEQEIPAIFVGWQASEVTVNREELGRWRERRQPSTAERPAA